MTNPYDLTPATQARLDQQHTVMRELLDTLIDATIERHINQGYPITGLVSTLDHVAAIQIAKNSGDLSSETVLILLAMAMQKLAVAKLAEVDR